MSTLPLTGSPTAQLAGPRGLAARHPVATFLALALPLGLAALTVPLVLDLEFAPFLLAMTFVALLGSSVLVTWAAEGGPGVRRLFARTVDWRFGPTRWAVVLFGMPVLTLALAAATGTLSGPDAGWLSMTGSYLFQTLIFGALLLNIWEETTWAGFLQTRLMSRHGLLLAAVLTAIPFSVIHIPLYLADGGSWSEIGRNVALLFALAPVYRYLIGMHLLDARGSLLAAGVQHASWNAAQSLDGVEGSWQVPVAVVLLTVLLALVRLARKSSR